MCMSLHLAFQVNKWWRTHSQEQSGVASRQKNAQPSANSSLQNKTVSRFCTLPNKLRLSHFCVPACCTCAISSAMSVFQPGLITPSALQGLVNRSLHNFGDDIIDILLLSRPLLLLSTLFERLEKKNCCCVQFDTILAITLNLITQFCLLLCFFMCFSVSHTRYDADITLIDGDCTRSRWLYPPNKCKR